MPLPPIWTGSEGGLLGMVADPAAASNKLFYTCMSVATAAGKAKDVEGYIRESIEHPSAYVVPGAMYSANGQSFMPATYVNDLKPEQIDQLVAYLASFK